MGYQTGDTITYTGSLTICVCCQCGMAFAMPYDFDTRRRADHQNFYCPQGHGQHFNGKSNEEKLKEELQVQRELKHAAMEREARVKRQLNAQKGITTKIKKRIHNGVCPCCNRSFENLAKHMKNQHPDYLKDSHG